MASGDPILEVIEAMPPATLAPGIAFLAGASTPAESVPRWMFDDSTIEYLDLKCRLSVKYAGGGLTLTLATLAAAASGNYIMQAAVRAIPDDAEDLDTTAHTYDFNTVTIAAPSAVGEISVDNIVFTHGADMDSLAAGEFFILRIARKASDAADTLVGDVGLLGLSGKET